MNWLAELAYLYDESIFALVLKKKKSSCTNLTSTVKKNTTQHYNHTHFSNHTILSKKYYTIHYKCESSTFLIYLNLHRGRACNVTCLCIAAVCLFLQLRSHSTRLLQSSSKLIVSSDITTLHIQIKTYTSFYS